MDWIRYLKIPDFKGIFARDSVDHIHKTGSCVINLDDGVGKGTHWVASFIKSGVIYYFDSFSLPPPLEFVEYVRKLGMKYQYNTNYKRKLFDKGFTPNWTEEIFVIDDILNTKPITYRLVDLQGEVVTGSFYEQELQKTTQEIFRIDEVIFRDKKRALVKWRGYPDKFNSWVPMSELKKLM